ncbi:MAG: hypothetical protein IKZ59_05905 [Clostridia bacterium]|nr:hypothetical protein [Clostridia bacterium]
MMNLIGKAIALTLCIIIPLAVFSAVVQADGNLAGTPSLVAGDINNDGAINNKDLTRLFQYLSDWEVEVNEAVLDVNGDGSVNNKDLTRLFQYLSDWDVEIFGNDNCPHTGGVADCQNQAICSICGKPYGEIDPNNHTEPDADGKCSRCGELLRLLLPADRIEKLEGTIVTSSNKYKKVKGYYGAVIDLADISFNSVTLTRSQECPELGYAFLRELPVLDTVPSYAFGYTKVIWDTSSTVTLAVPEDAKYMYVYHSSLDVNYLPEKVEFFGKNNNKEPGTFTIATWNVGHFSKGEHKNSDFSDSDYETKSAEFKAYIDGFLGADIITLSEYSKLFTPSNPTSSLFSSYTGASYEGEQRRYSCNAVYSKLELKNFEVHEFECNKDAVITYTNAVKAPDYYYITADLELNGETVTIVALHLAYDDKLYDTPPYIDTVCQNQMRELIEKFADVPRVIMLGDYNAYSPDYFDLFSDAGYTVCNDGSVLTCTGSKTGGLEWAVDNIIVKGVSVSGFRSVPTGLSDHVAVIATVSLLDE